jgi:hypothetical protein
MIERIPCVYGMLGKGYRRKDKRGPGMKSREEMGG